jgi:DNA-binding NarL/FixJ family response regulator
MLAPSRPLVSGQHRSFRGRALYRHRNLVTVAIAVLIGQFESLVAEGLIALLEDNDGIRVVLRGVASSDLEQAVTRYGPRLVILSDGVDHGVLARLNARELRPSLLVISRHPTRLQGTMLVAAGVSCVGIEASAEVIQSVVHSASRGHASFASAEGTWQEPNYLTPSSPLTARERELFGLLSAGYSNKQAALSMNIGVRTVATHAEQIRRKLGIQHKQELVGKALSS